MVQYMYIYGQTSCCDVVFRAVGIHQQAYSTSSRVRSPSVRGGLLPGSWTNGFRV